MPKVTWKTPPADHPDHLHDFTRMGFCVKCGCSLTQLRDQSEKLERLWGLGDTEPTVQLPPRVAPVMAPQRKPCLCGHSLQRHTHNHHGIYCGTCKCPKYRSLFWDRMSCAAGLAILVAAVLCAFILGTR